jgi:DNA-binding MarR family transcriptional regulator
VKHPPKLDLGDYLPYLVNRVGTIIAEQFSGEALAPHRLSIAMWRVMAVLSASGSQRQIDLAALTSTEASTLSRLVTRLARMGLVTRTRSTRSNREVAVKLSPKGAALVARLIPVALDYEAAAITGLPAAELAVLKRGLRRIYDNMKSRTAAM